MKIKLLLSLMLALVFASTSAYARESYFLGSQNVALKVDYISFTEDIFDEIDLESGVYVGLEGYYTISPSLYLGLEAGVAGSDSDDKIYLEGIGEVNIDIDLTYVPIELNLKYAFEPSPTLVIDFGAGICVSYFTIESDISSDLFSSNDSASDWIFGGQVFTDINYKMSERWFVGINAKYQFTDDLELDGVDTDTRAENFRVGANVGMMF